MGKYLTDDSELVHFSDIFDNLITLSLDLFEN